MVLKRKAPAPRRAFRFRTIVAIYRQGVKDGCPEHPRFSALPNISVSAEDRRPSHSNYLIGSDPAKWLRNLGTLPQGAIVGLIDPLSAFRSVAGVHARHADGDPARSGTVRTRQLRTDAPPGGVRQRPQRAAECTGGARHGHRDTAPTMTHRAQAVTEARVMSVTTDLTKPHPVIPLPPKQPVNH